MTARNMKIDGMHCHHCAMALRKSFTMIEGVTDAEVEVGKARVEYDEALVSDEKLFEAVTRLGYKVKG